MSVRNQRSVLVEAIYFCAIDPVKPFSIRVILGSSRKVVLPFLKEESRLLDAVTGGTANPVPCVPPQTAQQVC